MLMKPIPPAIVKSAISAIMDLVVYEAQFRHGDIDNNTMLTRVHRQAYFFRKYLDKTIRDGMNVEGVRDIALETSYPNEFDKLNFTELFEHDQYFAELLTAIQTDRQVYYCKYADCYNMSLHRVHCCHDCIEQCALACDRAPSCPERKANETL